MNLIGEADYAEIRYDQQGTVPPTGEPPDQQDVTTNDRNETSFAGGVRYRRSAEWSTSLVYSETRSDFLNQSLRRNNISRSALIGFFFSRPTLFVNLSGGYKEGSPNSSLYVPYSTGVGAFFASWFPIRWLEVRGFGTRRVVNSLSDVNPYFFENRIGGGIAIEVLSRFLVRGFGATGPNNYPIPQPDENGELVHRRDMTTIYGGGTSFRLARNAVLSGLVSHTMKTSNFPQNNRDYTGSRLS